MKPVYITNFFFIKGKTITIGFTYTMKGKSSKGKLYSEFKFDAVKEGARSVWIYKEECQVKNCID
jgi:hypothetical protein